MIISLIGVPAVGKSEILKSIMKSLGKSKPIKIGRDFKCTHFDDILVLGQYNDKTFSGTDSWGNSSIATGVFENLINFKVKKYRHIIFEGDWLISKLGFLAENFDTRIFLLTMTEEEERIRLEARKNRQAPKWLKRRHTQIKNLQLQKSLCEHIKTRENNNLDQSKVIQTEILNLLQENPEKSLVNYSQ